MKFSAFLLVENQLHNPSTVHNFRSHSNGNRTLRNLEYLEFRIGVYHSRPRAREVHWWLRE